MPIKRDAFLNVEKAVQWNKCILQGITSVVTVVVKAKFLPTRREQELIRGYIINILFRL
jgi:hypothetical protein